MYKQAFKAFPDSPIAPVGAATRLFSPILSDPGLDMLGGVGKYTLPQRGAGMALGALVGSYLAGPDNREVGATVGSGAGYLGAMGMDSAIRNLRRHEINKAIAHGVNTGTIIEPTVNGLLSSIDTAATTGLEGVKDVGEEVADRLDRMLRIYSSPGLSLAQDGYGTIINNYPMLHKLVNSPEALNKFTKGLADIGVTKNVRKYIIDGLLAQKNFFKKNAPPDVARLPILLHELLERKSSLFEKNPALADFDNSFKGIARDIYGEGISMNHNSMQVLGDEMSLASRVLNPKEIEFMKNLRHATGELPTLSALRNVNSMYDLPVGNKNLGEWANAASNAIRRGIESGGLMTQAEGRALLESKINKLLGQSGSALRSMESSAGDALMGLASKAKKYLPKLLGRIA